MAERYQKVMCKCIEEVGATGPRVEGVEEGATDSKSVEGGDRSQCSTACCVKTKLPMVSSILFC